MKNHLHISRVVPTVAILETHVGQDQDMLLCRLQEDEAFTGITCRSGARTRNVIWPASRLTDQA